MLKIFAGLATVVVAAYAFADLEGSYIVPQDHAAIQYKSTPVSDRVASLQQRLRDGKSKLGFSQQHGYLEAVLKALNIPEASQVLVYSKHEFSGSAHLSEDGARSVFR